MQRLKLFIDPKIKETVGPEVCWVWRLLLSSGGYLWEEVPLNCSECDIAYLADFERPLKARVKVKANLNFWHQKSLLRLQKVEDTNGLLHPKYYGEHDSLPTLLVTHSCLICERDVIFDVFWFVTGQEEKHWPKDKHGFFNLNGTGFLQEQVFQIAIASAISIYLEKKISELLMIEPVPRWPNGKRAAACFSHDVDYPEVRRFIEPLRIMRRMGIKGWRPALYVLRGKRDYWNFDSWVEMEKNSTVRSAFYFCGRPGSLFEYAFRAPDPFYDVKGARFQNVFERLKNEGFEIGLHASYRAFESEERFENEKNILQHVSGQRIWGNRHHYWHMNPHDVEATLLLHEKIGLEYDTSLSHERYIGWRRGLSWPFFPFNQAGRRELKTLQISTTWMDNQLFGYLRDNADGEDRISILQKLIYKACIQGGCLSVDFHDYVFDEVIFPDWLKTYGWLVENVAGCSGLWISTPKEIADHWIKRYNSMIRDSDGLELGL
jgi:hypothetical protein